VFEILFFFIPRYREHDSCPFQLPPNFLTRERNALVISLRPLFKFVFHRVHSVDVTRSISQ